MAAHITGAGRDRCGNRHTIANTLDPIAYLIAYAYAHSDAYTHPDAYKHTGDGYARYGFDHGYHLGEGNGNSPGPGFFDGDA
jgi:hypothetical protein